MAVLDWFRQGHHRDGSLPSPEEQLRARLEEESVTLRRLDIPEPELKEPLRMSAVGLRLPLFSLPNHVFIPFQLRGRNYLGFYVLASRREVARARSTLDEIGPHEVVRRFPGLWLNRDPYALYRNLNWYSTFEDGLPPTVDLTTLIPTLAPLQVVAGFTTAEVYYRLTWRQRLFAAYLEGHNFPIEVDAPNAPHVRCMDLLTVAATVPAKAPAPSPPRQSWCTLAIAASAADSLNRAAFLERLREFDGWFAYEVIVHGGALRFQLSFARQHRSSVEDLIATSLPSAQVTEVSHDDGCHLRLHRIDGVPTFPPGSLHHLESLPVDPLERLLTILAEMHRGDSVCVQVLFTYLGMEFFVELWKELKTIAHQSFAFKNMEGVGSKFPGWRMTVRLFSTNRALLERIAAEWLFAYESETRKWLLSETCCTSGMDRSPETWEIVDIDELASLIHFPPDPVARAARGQGR